LKNQFQHFIDTQKRHYPREKLLPVEDDREGKKKPLATERSVFLCRKDHMFPMRAGFGTLQITGCRAIIGPVP